MRQQIAAVLPCAAGEVPGARGVGGVGHQVGDRGGAREAPGDVVVREADRRDPGGILRLVLSEPTQLGGGDRGDRNGAGLARPDLGAEFGHQRLGRCAGAVVVPQHRGPHHGAVFIKRDEPVLLTANTHGSHILQATRLLDGDAQGIPPGLRIHLGSCGVGRRAGANERSGLGIPNHDLGRLRGGVDTGNEPTRGSHVSTVRLSRSGARERAG